MTVFSLPATPLASPTGLVDSLKPAAGAGGAPSDSLSFAQMLENAFGQVNALQGHSAQMAQAFAQGRTSDVHSVMIAAEQATMALQLTTQIRNKAVDAYQEIMRISM